MTNNDVIRSIQTVLGINEATIADIFKLAELPIESTLISGLLKDEQETGNIACANNQMTAFLNGLITYRRGKSEQSPNQSREIAQPLSNNIIYKKLRIAFDLKEDDLIELMSLADYEVSKSELSAISRKVGHKHYRACSDDFIMGLLIGLTFRPWN